MGDVSGGGVAGLAGLRQRLGYLEARSRVLAENVANADTPRFRPADIAAPALRQGGAVALAATNPRHIGAGRSTGDTASVKRFETRPNGNAVNLEDEMLRISQTQIEHQMLSGLYQRSLGLLKTAIGKRG